MVKNKCAGADVGTCCMMLPTAGVWMCRSEHEKNRRRDLITALRNRREQMQLSLKRDHSQQNRYLATTSQATWACCSHESCKQHR